MLCPLPFSLSVSLSRSSSEKWSFTSMAIERLLIFSSSFSSPTSSYSHCCRPTDCVYFFFFADSSSYSTLLRFLSLLAPLLLSTALLTSKWGDPFCSFSLRKKPPEIRSARLLTGSHRSIPTGTTALDTSVHTRGQKKSKRNTRLFFRPSFFLRLSSLLSARVRPHSATTR